MPQSSFLERKFNDNYSMTVSCHALISVCHLRTTVQTGVTYDRMLLLFDSITTAEFIS